MSTRCAPQYQT
ncbi:hypothetical protein GA0061098_1007333 [Bradyrhizobium shewense]|uniref:Uncharacterized protein n=1 Tax=Bradyrhizobium shewense TaxID=1761772 RepID=A0A1C3WFY4_9BRAD|nr:hypothetical protein GA0061098_1007333 [Bradyrhizobium shewense]